MGYNYPRSTWLDKEHIDENRYIARLAIRPTARTYGGGGYEYDHHYGLTLYGR
jgi:hypothetical protein